MYHPPTHIVSGGSLKYSWEKKQKNRSAREEHHLLKSKERKKKENKTEKTFSSLGCAMNDKWYFVTKIVLLNCEKKLFLWSRKTFEIQGWRPRIYKNFEISWTIYSNSERSEQFLVTVCFFNLFLEVSHI